MLALARRAIVRGGRRRTDGRRDHCFETPFAMKFTSDRSSPSPVSAPDDDAPARHGDVETLRRLTREAFGEITAIRDRVRSVERLSLIHISEPTRPY